jgi:hypothetical protein
MGRDNCWRRCACLAVCGLLAGCASSATTILNSPSPAISASQIAVTPSTNPSPSPTLVSFSQTWYRHGLRLTIDSRGHGAANWRTYRNCATDSPPCDSLTPTSIVGGGVAALELASVDGQAARGQVLSSSDPSTLAPGAITMTLLAYDMARLDPAGMILCGPDFGKNAPPNVLHSSPCGA